MRVQKSFNQIERRVPITGVTKSTNSQILECKVVLARKLG